MLTQGLAPRECLITCAVARHPLTETRAARRNASLRGHKTKRARTTIDVVGTSHLKNRTVVQTKQNKTRML